jgi:hypothetical protein
VFAIVLGLDHLHKVPYTTLTYSEIKKAIGDLKRNWPRESVQSDWINREDDRYLNRPHNTPCEDFPRR